MPKKLMHCIGFLKNLKRIFHLTLLINCSVKEMMGPKPHTQLDADLAAGMGMPDNGPKLMPV